MMESCSIGKISPTPLRSLLEISIWYGERMTLTTPLRGVMQRLMFQPPQRPSLSFRGMMV